MLGIETPFSSRIRLYEQAPMREVAGDMIRPGGLALTDYAIAFCHLPADARVLDVGCGPGASVEHLISQHHMSALGVDPSVLLLSDAHKRNAALPLVQSPGECLPFAANVFDAVMAECSLSVIKEPARALTEFRRVLRDDGYLIITDIYARNPHSMAALSKLNVISCLSGAMLRDEVIDLVKRCGFAVRVWEDHTNALRVFTAQLIWQNGSVGQFWCRTIPSRADACTVQNAIAQSKPGYYLLIAQKT